MAGTFPGGGGFPSVILPGRAKKFHYETSFGPEHKKFFDSLWSRAAAALKRADEIVLCGYSLLSVDQRACDLLLSTPRKDTSVMVVSGRDGERISNSFRSAAFQNVSFYQNGYFEKWVGDSITIDLQADRMGQHFERSQAPSALIQRQDFHTPVVTSDLVPAIEFARSWLRQ